MSSNTKYYNFSWGIDLKILTVYMYLHLHLHSAAYAQFEKTSSPYGALCKYTVLSICESKSQDRVARPQNRSAGWEDYRTQNFWIPSDVQADVKFTPIQDLFNGMIVFYIEKHATKL